MVLLLVGVTAAGIFGVPTTRDVHDDEPFAIDRAMSHLEFVAREARPNGSAWNRSVGDYLVGRLTDYGLRVQEQVTEVEGLTVRNIFTTRAGTGSTGTLLLCAHYDSVPQSSGAADDSVGIAVLLEVARDLAKRPVGHNDVVVLFTDGEENGLYGAYAFATRHPVFDGVTTVVNVDCIGGGGLPIVYETGADNGRLIRTLAQAVGSAGGAPSQSVVPAIYEQTGLWTDFRVYRNGGRNGLNVSLAGQAGAFHTGTDTADHVNKGSVGALGTLVRDLTRTLANADMQNIDEPDRVYFTLPGPLFIHYPSHWNVMLIAVNAAAYCFLILRRGRPRIRDVLPHLAMIGGMMVVALLVVFIAWIIAQFTAYIAGDGSWLFGAVTLRSPTAVRVELFGIAVLTLAVAWGAPRSWERANAAALDAAVLTWLAPLLIVQWRAPAASYLLVWPIGCLIVSELVRGTGGSSKRTFAAWLVAMLPLLLVVPAVELMYQLTQAWMLVALGGAAISFSFCWSMQGHLWVAAYGSSRAQTAAAMGAVGVLMMMAGALLTL